MSPQLSHDDSKIASRYRDGYRLAKVIDNVGALCKMAGLVLGCVIVVLTLINYLPGTGSSIIGNSSSGGIGLFFGLLIGGLVAALGYVIGVIISAQGQILKAGLDTAVNGSPFLSDDQKMTIMSLS